MGLWIKLLNSFTSALASLAFRFISLKKPEEGFFLLIKYLASIKNKQTAIFIFYIIFLFIVYARKRNIVELKRLEIRLKNVDNLLKVL